MPAVSMHPGMYWIGDPLLILNDTDWKEFNEDTPEHSIVPSHLGRAPEAPRQVSLSGFMLATVMPFSVWPVCKLHDLGNPNDFDKYRSNFNNKYYYTQTRMIACTSSLFFNRGYDRNKPDFIRERQNYSKKIEDYGRWQPVKETLEMRWDNPRTLLIDVDGGHKLIKIFC